MWCAAGGGDPNEETAMADEVEHRKRKGLHLSDVVILGAIGVVGLVVGFWVFDHILGILWLFVKLAVLVVVVGFVLALILRHRK